MHRDIKSANILADKDGKCKLSDFGVSETITKGSEESVKRDFKGTANYLPPETINNSEYTRFSDIWSLGCTIFEMLTGSPPWSEFSNEFAVMNKISKITKGPELPEEASDDLKDFLECCFK